MPLAFIEHPLYAWCFISSVQSLSHVRLCDPMDCSTPASLSITNTWSLLKPMFIESVIPSNHLILCRPLILLPSVLPSIRVFSSEPVIRIMWPKYWSFRFSIRPQHQHQNIQDWFPLGLTRLISLQSKGLSRVSSNTTVQKHQFFRAKLSLWMWSKSHIRTWLLKKP